MPCTLDKYTTYPLANVKKDVSDNRIVVKLDNPPSSCPEGVFTSKKAMVKVLPDTSPFLMFNTSKNVPIVTVPSQAFVQNINVPESHALMNAMYIVCAAILFVAFYHWLKWIMRPVIMTSFIPNGHVGPSSYVPVAPVTPYTPSLGGAAVHIPITSGVATPVHSTVVVNGGNNGLVEGMMLNEMMHHHNHSEVVRERIIEREAPVEESRSYSSDNSSQDNSYSSDSSSYSSDSGSSYSSDSGSSSSDSFSSD